MICHMYRKNECGLTMKCSTVSGNVAEYRRTCRLFGRCESSLSRIPLKSWERSLSASSRHRIRHFSTLATFLSIKSRIRPGVATTRWTENVSFNITSSQTFSRIVKQKTKWICVGHEISKSSWIKYVQKLWKKPCDQNYVAYKIPPLRLGWC